MKNRKIILMLCITVISNVLGLFREVQISYWFGTSTLTDNIILSQLIPIIIIGYTFFTFTNAYIPFFSKNRIKYEETKLNNISVLTITVASFFTIIVTILLLKYIYKIFFGIEVTDILMNQTRILMIASLCMAFTAIPMGYLQSKGLFYIVNISNMIIVNIFIVVCIAITGKNPYGLSIGYSLGTYTAFIIILFYAMQKGFKLSVKKGIENKLLKEYSSIAFSILTVSLINQFFNIIDRALASHFVEGTVSAVYFSNRIIGIVIMLLVTPIVTIFFPKLTKIFEEKEYDEFLLVNKSLLVIMVIVCIPTSCFIFIFSNTIVSILFERGDFNQTSTDITSNLLKFYIFFLIAWCLREIASKALIAKGLHNSLLKNTFFLLLTNFLVGLLLSKLLGPIGIPLGSGIGVSVSVLLMYANIFKFQSMVIPIKEGTKFLLLIVVFGMLFLIVKDMFVESEMIRLIVGILILLLNFLAIFNLNFFNIKIKIRSLLNE